MEVFARSLQRFPLLKAFIEKLLLPLIVAVFFSLSAWQMVSHGWHLRGTGQTIASAPVPIWPFWLVVGVLFAITFLASVAAALHQLKRAGGQGTAQDHHRS